MNDDDINRLLDRLHALALEDAQVRCLLDLLAAAEVLNAKLARTLMPVQQREARLEIAGAMQKIFQH